METTLPTWCQGWRIRLGGLLAPLELRACGGSPVTPDVSQAPSSPRASLPKPDALRDQRGAPAGLDRALDGPKIRGDLARHQLEVPRAEHARRGAGIGEARHIHEIPAFIHRAPGRDGVGVIHANRVEPLAEHKDIG